MLSGLAAWKSAFSGLFPPFSRLPEQQLGNPGNAEKKLFPRYAGIACTPPLKPSFAAPQFLFFVLFFLFSANKGLPLPLGCGVCEAKSENGRSRPRKTFISGVFCAQRGIETMVWGRGRSGDCDFFVVSVAIWSSFLSIGVEGVTKRRIVALGGSVCF